MHEIPGLDIGAGTPSEILREGEFTQSLLLLYFSNFSDVHFMFDEELFLRQVVMGQVPKIILYAMMALSIRYSHAPFDDAVSQAHRGEILYDHARELMKDEFDTPSIHVVQAYVLLSTYKLTFGGSRLANIYLGKQSSLTCTFIRTANLHRLRSEYGQGVTPAGRCRGGSVTTRA
jgi:hypothetical protein